MEIEKDKRINLLSHESVGHDIQAKNANWSFDKIAPEKFDDHARDSIPYYLDGHELICQISDYFVREDSLCYDLGCSTGELTKKMALSSEERGQWIGIDQSSQMIDEAKKRNQTELRRIQFECSNLLHYDFAKSDLMVAYYTIQFIPPKWRQELINRIYESLNWSGGFLFFEKVRGPDARFQDLFTGLYQDFKLARGLVPSEILAKSRSLKGVLEPFSSQANQDFLKRAGFRDITPVFRYLCFEGLLAIK